MIRGRVRALFALTSAGVLFAISAFAEITPVWSLDELSSFSTLVVSGRVAAVTSQWDPAVNAIYTYAVIDVAETWKGQAPGQQVVVKMLGGITGDLQFRVEGQPVLREGETVALWLEARPRDGTLYTAGLWQGVWRLPASGSDVAERRGPDGQVRERRSVADLRGIAARSPSAAASVVPFPPEFVSVSPFSFLPPSEGGPGRWHEADAGAVVGVDFQAPPAGLGGGLAEFTAAIALWNGSGMSLQLQPGIPRSPRCAARSATTARSSASAART
jgi:hypothetical protein